jgi:hypothetical protein
MPAPGNRSCSSLYLQFSIAISATKKSRLNLSQRPIPFVPQHLRTTYSVRTLALVDSFLRSDVAAPVSRDTLEWMLTNGHCIWMFDGLDELYSGDPEFFDYILDLLTRPESRAQIVICARDSLLSSNDTSTSAVAKASNSEFSKSASQLWAVSISARGTPSVPISAATGHRTGACRCNQGPALTLCMKP